MTARLKTRTPGIGTRSAAVAAVAASLALWIASLPAAVSALAPFRDPVMWCADATGQVTDVRVEGWRSIQCVLDGTIEGWAAEYPTPMAALLPAPAFLLVWAAVALPLSLARPGKSIPEMLLDAFFIATSACVAVPAIVFVVFLSLG